MSGVIGGVLHERGRLWLPYTTAAASLAVLFVYSIKKEESAARKQSSLGTRFFLALWAQEFPVQLWQGVRLPPTPWAQGYHSADSCSAKENTAGREIS